MANTFIPTGQLLGTSFSATEVLSDGVLRHDLGTRVEGNEGSVFIYCQANGAIAGDAYVCLIDEAYQVAELDEANGATGFGQMVGVAKSAWADNEYGWIQIAGTADIRVAANCAADAQLYNTTTDGVLDDAATSGLEAIDGIAIKTANGGSTANVEGVLTFPRVGATV